MPGRAIWEQFSAVDGPENRKVLPTARRKTRQYDNEQRRMTEETDRSPAKGPNTCSSPFCWVCSRGGYRGTGCTSQRVGKKLTLPAKMAKRDVGFLPARCEVHSVPPVPSRCPPLVCARTAQSPTARRKMRQYNNEQREIAEEHTDIRRKDRTHAARCLAGYAPEMGTWGGGYRGYRMYLAARG